MDAKLQINFLNVKLLSVIYQHFIMIIVDKLPLFLIFKIS